MELHKALRQIIKSEGKYVLSDKRLLNMLKDLQALDDIQGAKYIIRVIIDNGYGRKFVSSNDDDMKIRSLYIDFIESTGFNSDNVSMIFSSIIFGMGWSCSLFGMPSNYVDPDMSDEKLYYWGRLYSSGTDFIQSNEDIAFQYYLASALKGYGPAQHRVAKYYAEKDDYAEAFKWFRNSADQGDKYDQYFVGDCYENGQMVTQNTGLALEYYRKSAAQGYGAALHKLAKFWEEKEEYSKAFEFYRKAAEREYAMAYWDLGRCYEDGVGVAKNLANAFDWYEKAANNDIVEAQYDIGRCYENGIGVAINYNMAKKWYEMAAEDIMGLNAKLALDDLILKLKSQL